MSVTIGIVGLLVLGAVICAIMAASNPPKVPIYISIILLAIAVAVAVLPKG